MIKNCLIESDPPCRAASHFHVCCWIDWLLMIKNCLIESSPPCRVGIYQQQKVLSHFPLCCWIDWLLMIKNCLTESGPPCRAGIYQQQKVLSHFPVCCWIDWLLVIKNCLTESGPPCSMISFCIKHRALWILWQGNRLHQVASATSFIAERITSSYQSGTRKRQYICSVVEKWAKITDHHFPTHDTISHVYAAITSSSEQYYAWRPMPFFFL
jgi:hypothetical protein